MSLDSVAIVNQFSDEIRTRATDIENARQIPQDLADKFADAGLFRLLVPDVYGGAEVHPQQFFDTLELAGRADGAVGWVLMIASTTGMLSASLPESHAKQIYQENPNVITTGVTAPIGKALPVADGLDVTGHWPFGSGSQVSDWICGGCFVMEDGKPRKNKKGLPEPLLVFFRRDEVDIHDNWHTSGLRGTGSNDISVANLIVPEGRWCVLGKRSRIDAPLYRFPTLGLLALGVSAVSLGIAQHAVDAFIELATDKIPTGSTRALASRSASQKDLALAQASINSARALTAQTIGEAWEKATQNGRLEQSDKAALRLAATNNTWSAVSAVDRLYHAAGGSAIYSKSDFQRCFRDVHVTTQHIMVAQPTLEVVGKVMLGIDPQTML